MKTLTYFGVAAAVLLLREAKSFSIGDTKFELFERKLEALETKIEDTQAAAVGGRSAEEAAERKTTEGSIARPTFAPERGTPKDDPWKGVFGRQAVSGTRELSAEVTPIGTPGLYRIRLQVRSTSPARSPLRGSVQFFLHDTFRNDHLIVTVALATSVSSIMPVRAGYLTVVHSVPRSPGRSRSTSIAARE